MIYRVDVRAKGINPAGESVRQQIGEMGIDAGHTQSARIFLIDTDSDQHQIARAARELLADPIVETATVNAPARGGSVIEIHLKPGVMDPVAASTEMALRDIGILARQVRTGRAYAFEH